MLVVVANWAFTDGTLVASGNRRRNARAWLRDVRRAVIRSGFGRDGRYAPPGGVDVVLAGDTFDCLTTAAWSGTLRPWQGGARVAAARRKVLIGCARRAAPLLAGLAAWARRGLDVPAADRWGRPAVSTAACVPVRVTLLVGERDGPLDDSVADIAARGVAVARSWSDGEVLVRHGHEFDPACHVEEPAPAGGRPPTLAESVAVDLVARFIAGLEVDRAAVPAAALAAAAVGDLPAVWSAWTGSQGPGAALDRAVADAWLRAVDAWERAARREPPECGLPASPVADLAAWLAAPVAAPMPAALAGLLDRRGPTAASHGMRSVVLGHAVRVPLDAATICLDSAASRPCRSVSVVRADGAVEVACVAAGTARESPATIACRETEPGGPAWRWIAGGDEAPRWVTHALSPVVDAA